MRKVCGFVGLGRQGAPIAQRIIEADYPVIIWARRGETLDKFRCTGAVVAASLVELGEKSDHIGICVDTDSAVMEVCEQLIPAMRAGSTIAIHSTTHPDTCRRLEHEAIKRNCQLIDAPVSGGPSAASAGKLTVMMGGTETAIIEMRPIFATFSHLMMHMGPVGSAQIAKLINNTLMAANLALAHSAFSSGTELNLDRTQLKHLLEASSGRSYALQVYARQERPGVFDYSRTLLEKVDLLSDIIGKDHPTFKSLREATDALRTDSHS